MRVLVINSALYTQPSVPGEEWSILVGAVEQQNHLWAYYHENLVDYDIFILDSDKVEQKARPEDARLISPEIIERVEAGGCLLCFGGQRSVPWLPVALPPRGGPGTRVLIETDSDYVAPSLLGEVLAKHRSKISYRTQFEQSEAWTAVARAMNGYPIAALVERGRGYLVMLPEFSDRAAVTRDILDKVLPQILPGMFRPAAARPIDEAPDWIGEFTIPQAEALSTEVSRLQTQIEGLLEEREKKDEQRRELEEYRGLLWLEGKPLELVVQKALNLLGIPAQPKDPVDLACHRTNGGELFIEIEGTTGPIQVRKARQLLGYIAEADDPSETLGALVGNPFRREHPNTRPVTGNPEEVFSPQVRRMAETHHWHLVTTTQVFGWVRRFLDGEIGVTAVARTALGLD